MDVKTKARIKLAFLPVYLVYKDALKRYRLRHSKELMDRIFYRIFHRRMDWENPQDLNEKINWLKFHADMREWARLADKCEAWEYVRERGLEDILIPLYGVWDSPKKVLDDWDALPESFMLKSNNGCGHVMEVKDKGAVDKKALLHTLTLWFAETDYGANTGEFHYLYVKNRVLAEALLTDDSIAEFSKAPVDYKIHCCDGKPYICYTSYGRTLTAAGSHQRIGDLYDLQWNQRSDLMSEKKPRRTLPKPENWEKMLEIAAALSAGHPQMRVDLYNIGGKIYFGELTMSSAGGFDDEFSQELYRDMGERITLDLNVPGNEFDRMSKPLAARTGNAAGRRSV